MTVDDDLELVTIADVLMAPDGQSVFFSKSELDWKENKRKKSHFMIPAEGGEQVEFIGEAGGSSFQFSPDGQFLSLKRKVEKHSQIFLMRTDGGEAIQLTQHGSSVGEYKWSPDGQQIFFVAARIESKDAQKRREKGFDAIYVDEGPNSNERGRWEDLWVVDLKSKEEKRLTEKDFQIGDFDVDPSGRRIILTARFENRRNQEYLSEIYLLEVDQKQLQQLTHNQVPETNLKWAPNGNFFSYSARHAEKWDLRLEKIWILDPKSQQPRLVSDPFDGNIHEVFWSPDSSSILFSGLRRTDSNLFRLDLKDGDLEQLTDLQGTVRAHGFSRDRSRVVYSFSDFDTPSDLYTSKVDSFEPIRLTRLNPRVEEDLLLATMKIVEWKSKDGLPIEGLLYLPPDYESGSPVPLILNIHGGPAGVFSNTFNSRYHIYAGLGYASLAPNVRGSSGYGDQLLRGNMHDIGGGDYWDLMTGVDYVVEQGYADPERLGLRGWSYGGILGGWTITQTDRFKAASIGAGVYDWTSEYGPGFNYDVRLWYIGGTPWENPEAYREVSALTHVENVTTPTLLLHGIEDPVDTEPQSMMFFSALKDMGKTVRYIRFPREKHGFEEPRHQRTRDIEEIRWMQRYVRGIEWEPWERPEEEEAAEDDESGD